MNMEKLKRQLFRYDCFNIASYKNKKKTFMKISFDDSTGKRTT